MNKEKTEVSAEVNALTLEDNKTFNKNKWIFSISGIGRDMLYTLVSTYFLQYVQYGITLTWQQFLTLSLLIGIVGRIWDGINDPMMGAIIDGSKLKWGKFKPWIFLGALLDSIFTVILFNVRPSGWAYVALICAIYLLFEAAFTMNDIGYWSMIPSLSRSKSRRDKITTLTVFFAGLGTIIMTALVTFFAPGKVLLAYSLFSIIAAIAVVGSQTITAIFVKEAPREEAETKTENKVSLKKMVKTILKNKQLLWISLASLLYSISTAILIGSVYNLYYLEVGYNGDIFVFMVIYAIGNTLLSLVYPKLAEKLGRKKIQTISFIIVATGYLGLALIGWTSFLPFNIVTLCIFGFMVFAGGTWFYLAQVINLNNCVEYNEYTTGERNEAVVTTMRPLIVKFADAVKYLIITLTLILSGLFAITNKISAQETQTSTFSAKLANTSEVREYVVAYNLYLAEYNSYGDDITKEEIDILDNKIAQVDVLKKCQVRAEFLKDVGYMYLVRYEVVDGKRSDERDYYMELGNPATALMVLDGDYEYALEISIDKDNNSADRIFNTHKTTKVRIILRLSSTLIPVLCILFSWLIQNKKFIIDEKYFDEITKEINKRKNKEEVSSIE